MTIGQFVLLMAFVVVSAMSFIIGWIFAIWYYRDRSNKDRVFWEERLKN